MISLTHAEKRLRDFLADRAAGADPGDPADSTITYGDLADELDRDGSLGWSPGHPSWSHLRTALFHIAAYESERGRPVLSALVVREGGIPGLGFGDIGRQLGRVADESADAEYRFWKTELDASVRYWTSPGARAAALLDPRLDAVTADLGKIKQMLRTLLHG